jgi:cell division inhibitor SulA
MTSNVHALRVGVTAGVAVEFHQSPKRHAAIALKKNTQVLHAHIKRRRTHTSQKVCAWMAGIARAKHDRRRTHIRDGLADGCRMKQHDIIFSDTKKSLIYIGKTIVSRSFWDIHTI